MRLSGFASGMDINQMVADLMKAQRMPLNKLTQQKTLLEWKRDSYRETNKLLTDFNNLSFDMTLQRNYAQKSVTSSKAEAVSATATTSATNGTYTINNVSPATNAFNYSTAAISRGEKIDLNSSVWEQRANFDGDAARFTGSTMWKAKETTQREILITSPNQSIKLDKGALQKASLTSLTITGADGQVQAPITVTYDKTELETDPNKVFIDQNTGEIVFGSAIELEAGSKINEFTHKHFTFDFEITTYNTEGTAVPNSFVFDGTASMNDVIKKINESKAGVTAFYDEGTDKLMITRKDTGDFNASGKEMEFKGLFLTNVLKMDSSVEQGGEKASFTLNGMPTTRNSNSFTVNGVTFNLHEATNSPVTITVNNDSNKTFDAIKNYIDKYNELIEKVGGKLNETLYRDYKPLTDDERETLTDKQQEQWEEKARSGLLKNDSILSSGLNRMRTSFYSTISDAGSFSQLSQIGITTSPNYRDGGKLIINEDKLRQAIEKDPNSVMELFTKAKGEDGSQGIARKLREDITATIKNIEARAGNSTRTNSQFTMGREMTNVDRSIKTFESRLQTIETRYWRQFTAMEKAINVSNNQSMQLMSQFYNNG